MSMVMSVTGDAVIWLRVRNALPLTLAFVPVVAFAQPPRFTSKVGSGRTLTGACASLPGAPSELVRSPEGMAVLRLKRELDDAASVYSQKRMSAEAGEVKRMAEMQRGVDSMVQVLVRMHGGEGAAERTIVLRRGDSTATLRTRVVEDKLLSGKALEGRLPFELMDGSNKGVEVFVRTLEPQVKEFATATARINGKIASSGFLGVNMSGAQIRSISDSGSFTAHCDYPVIESVELGSPAREAGLQAGDTIVAYNGRDVVAQVVNYPQLLVPGKVVKVRVRRDGKAREIPVTVGERPREMTDNFMFRVSPQSSGFTTAIVTGTPLPPAPVTFNVSSGVVLGAQLNAIDEEFAQTLGLEPGLLVMRVQTGSPVAEAGVKAGEVIKTVNGTATRDIRLLQRAAVAPGAHEIRLVVTARAAAPRTVVVRF